MKTVLVKDNECSMPRLSEILPGTLIEYQNSIYIKMAKSKMGQGLSLQWPKGFSVLFNIKHGSCRAVCAEDRVQILGQVDDLRVCRLTDPVKVSPYLRNVC